MTCQGNEEGGLKVCTRPLLRPGVLGENSFVEMGTIFIFDKSLSS
jgi:hypothetical protein